jgi:hypothetical protein
LNARSIFGRTRGLGNSEERVERRPPVLPVEEVEVASQSSLCQKQVFGLARAVWQLGSNEEFPACVGFRLADVGDGREKELLRAAISSFVTLNENLRSRDGQECKSVAWLEESAEECRYLNGDPIQKAATKTVVTGSQL